jgi:hypothetical protein
VDVGVNALGWPDLAGSEDLMPAVLIISKDFQDVCLYSDIVYRSEAGPTKGDCMRPS